MKHLKILALGAGTAALGIAIMGVVIGVMLGLAWLFMNLPLAFYGLGFLILCYWLGEMVYEDLNKEELNRKVDE